MIFDGAFGTYYITKTNDYEPCERANLTSPETVLAIHREYISVGVDAIKTNTFETCEREVIARGYELATQAARDKAVKVFADVGPKQDMDEYLKVANIFIELGAKNFLFETLVGLDELAPALRVIKQQVENATIIVSFAVSRDGFAASGQSFQTLIGQALADENVDIVGLNCMCGPAHMLELVRKLVPPTKPLAAMPNSGYPSTVNGRTVYNNNPQYFASKLLDIKKTGVSILGGCCGTTPEHISCAIRAIRESTKDKSANPKYAHIATAVDSAQPKFARKTIAVELDPPLDCDIDFVLQAADKLKDAGVDIITLADSPLSRARADSFLTAALIRREKNIEVLPHLTCRDRNFIAIKGALLGASFHGISQVLALTGDSVVSAENYRNPGVFNFNSKELIGYINNLNNEIFHGKEFAIGGAINVNSLRFDLELSRCTQKVANGASFLYSQPLFSAVSIENFARARQELDCKLFAGILPIVSYKNALFLNNELSGIDVPQDLIAKLEGKTPEQAQTLSMQFCRDVISSVYDLADGFYLVTPMKKVELICKIIESVFL